MVSILDGHIAPDHSSGLNEGMLSDITVRADGHTLHQMGKSPDASTLAKLLSFYNCCWMNEHISHKMNLRNSSDALN